MKDHPQVRCEICQKGPLDPSFRRGDDSIALYWADPKLIADIAVPVYFCGPQHSLEWFKGRNYKNTRQ